MKPLKILRARVVTLPLKTDEQLMREAGVAWESDLPWLRACNKAWDRAEIFVYKNDENDKRYTMSGWDTKDDEIDARVREAFWQMEQDPIMGTYCNDREAFDEAWREGEYEPAGGITFPETDIVILEETKEERLTRMIAEHPGMRVVPMVDYEIVAGDDCEKWAGSIGDCRVRQYTYGINGEIGETFMYKNMARDLVDNMVEHVEDREEYKKARSKAWDKVNKANWKTALFVDIDLPEMIEDCQEEIYNAMKGEQTIWDEVDALKMEGANGARHEKTI